MNHNHDDNDGVVLGDAHFFDGDAPLFLRRADRRQHLFVVGKTGSGKSTLMKSLLVEDICAGEGVGLIDPHGDLANEILNEIPAWRTDDVIVFDPADTEYPVALNLLSCPDPQQKHLAASGLVSAFKSVWGRESWGPRLEYTLLNAVLLLMDCENASLLGLPRLLTDERYREWAVRQCKDPIIRAYWSVEFAAYSKQFAVEVASPILNKVGQLLAHRTLRNVLSQVKSKIDFPRIIDQRQIFIANLSKGKVGTAPANLLGSFLLNQFQQAAMQRAVIPEHDRHDFWLHVDEFHNYVTDSFVSLLSEIRKYRLGMTLVAQYLDQTTPEVRSAIFGNAGSLIAFRVGETDAAVLAREYGHDLSPSLFSGLDNYQMVAKVLQQGKHFEPVLGKTRNFKKSGLGNAMNILSRSRERFSSPRLVVEERINRWLRK